jgi:hypothetical protein
MLKKSLIAASTAATLLVSGYALADAPFHRTTDETGSVYHGTEYRKVGDRWQRVDTWNDFASQGAAFERAYRTGDVSPDGLYVYVGDAEGTWQVRPHGYDFQGGKLTHADDFTHSAAAANANLSREEGLKLNKVLD